MWNKILIGVGIAEAVVIAGETFLIVRTTKKLNDLDKEIEDASKAINVDIPNGMLTVAMDRAAKQQAEKSAKSVEAMAEAAISQSVDEAVKAEKNRVKDSVEKELEEKISLLDINDIKKEVVTQASLNVADNVISRIPLGSSRDNTAEIIRACKDAGITTSWQIGDILNSAKGRKEG